MKAQLDDEGGRLFSTHLNHVIVLATAAAARELAAGSGRPPAQIHTPDHHEVLQVAAELGEWLVTHGPGVWCGGKEEGCDHEETLDPGECFSIMQVRVADLLIEANKLEAPAEQDTDEEVGHRNTLIAAATGFLLGLSINKSITARAIVLTNEGFRDALLKRGAGQGVPPRPILPRNGAAPRAEQHRARGRCRCAACVAQGGKRGRR